MFTKKGWQYKADGIYMVVLGAGVAETAATGCNLCSDYCGYHGSGFTAQIQKFYYGVVGFS
jgi:hypothetical protein